MFLNSLPNFNVPGVVHIKFFWYTELSIYIYSSTYSFKLGYIKTTDFHDPIKEQTLWEYLKAQVNLFSF